jgi:hypothetical protein
MLGRVNGTHRVHGKTDCFQKGSEKRGSSSWVKQKGRYVLDYERRFLVGFGWIEVKNTLKIHNSK